MNKESVFLDVVKLVANKRTNKIKYKLTENIKTVSNNIAGGSINTPIAGVSLPVTNTPSVKLGENSLGVFSITSDVEDSYTLSIGEGSFGLVSWGDSIFTVPKDTFDIAYYIIYSDGGESLKLKLFTQNNFISPLFILAVLVVPPNAEGYSFDYEVDSNKMFIAYGASANAVYAMLTQGDLVSNNLTNVEGDLVIGRLIATDDVVVGSGDEAVELTSHGLDIYNVDFDDFYFGNEGTATKTLLANFNKDGVYFYDSEGDTLSSYRADGADIAGWSIDSDKLSSPTSSVVLDSEDERLEINSTMYVGKYSISETDYHGIYINQYNQWRDNGYFRTGDATHYMGYDPGTTSFEVKGTIYADGGIIGGLTTGWAINDSGLLSSTNFKLQSGSSPYLYIGSDSTPAYEDVGIWLGISTVPKLSLYSDANNFLKWDGSKLLIEAANFTLDASGNITASNVDLTGEITATTGAIGGWSIDSTRIYSSGIELDSANYHLSIGQSSHAYDYEGVYLGYTGSIGKFSLKNSGGSKYFRWTGSALEIDAGDFTVDSSGAITASNGRIGSWYLGSTALTSYDPTGDSVGIKLNKTENRMEINSTGGTDIAIGYLGSITGHNNSEFGIWVGKADAIYIEAPNADDEVAKFISGDWIVQNNANIIIGESALLPIINLGSVSGTYGLYIYDGTGTDSSDLLASYTSSGILLNLGNNTMKIGDNVNSTNDGIYINTTNYWYDDGEFKAGNTTNYMRLVGGSLSIRGAIEADTGHIGGTSGWDIDTNLIKSTNIELNASSQYLSIGQTTKSYNQVGVYLGYDTVAKFSLYKDGDHYLKWDGDKLEIESDHFTLDSTGKLTADEVSITGSINVSAGGTVGGWNIGSDTISSGGGTYPFTLKSGSYPYLSMGQTSGIGYGSNGIYLGFHDISGYKPTFSLVEGSSYFKYDTANGLDYKGGLSQPTGTVAGWTLNDDYLKSNSNTIFLSSGNATSGTFNYPFISINQDYTSDAVNSIGFLESGIFLGYDGSNEVFSMLASGTTVSTVSLTTSGQFSGDTTIIVHDATNEWYLTGMTSQYHSIVHTITNALSEGDFYCTPDVSDTNINWYIEALDSTMGVVFQIKAYAATTTNYYIYDKDSTVLCNWSTSLGNSDVVHINFERTATDTYTLKTYGDGALKGTDTVDFKDIKYIRIKVDNEEDTANPTASANNIKSVSYSGVSYASSSEFSYDNNSLTIRNADFHVGYNDGKVVFDDCGFAFMDSAVTGTTYDLDLKWKELGSYTVFANFGVDYENHDEVNYSDKKNFTIKNNNRDWDSYVKIYAEVNYVDETHYDYEGNAGIVIRSDNNDTTDWYCEIKLETETVDYTTEASYYFEPAITFTTKDSYNNSSGVLMYKYDAFTFNKAVAVGQYSSAPTTLIANTDGTLYYNTSDNKLYLRANGSWVALN